MANEITASFSVRAEKSEQLISHLDTILVTMTGADMIANMQSVGTSNEQVLFGDTAPGMVCIQNLDATNYVEIFGDNMNMQKIAKLRPGEFLITWLDGSTSLYARANTADCVCRVLAADV